MKILILGSTGVLGTAMEEVCQDRNLDYVALSHDRFEITNFRETEITRYNCDVLVNGVAMMGIDPCEENSVRAFAINSASVNKLAKICQEKDMILIQPSTHTVFGGSRAEEHTEKSEPNPTSVYGISKYASEFFAKNLCERHYITRFPVLFGNRRNNPIGFIDKLPNWLNEGKTLKISTDKHDSFSYNRDVVGRTIDLVEGEAPFGIYHIMNEGFSSYYEFAIKMRDLYGLNNEIQKASDSDFPSLAAKPIDTKMSSIKIQPLRRFEDALEEFVKENATKR